MSDITVDIRRNAPDAGPMSTDALAPATGLTADVASEIRAHLGRYSISRSELSRRLGVDDTWVGKRLNGRTEITLHDLERIADVLGVKPGYLVPRRYRGDTETYPTLAAKPTVRPIRLPTQRLNRRPGDGRPVGHPGGTRRPDGSRRTSRIA